MFWNLPEELVHNVLLSWVDVANFCRLDSAMCNKPLRANFLHLISVCGFIIRRCSKFDGDDERELEDQFMIWVMRRDLAMSELTVTESFAWNHYERGIYLQRYGTLIKSVTIKEGGVTDSNDAEAVVFDLCEYCPNVLTLGLRFNACSTTVAHITDSTLIALLEGCSLLENIALEGCAFLTDKTLMAIGVHCHNLRKLYADYTKITHKGVAAIAAGCPLLEELSVCECRRIGPAMEEVARRCPRLRMLRAAKVGLTSAAVLALAECCPLLVCADVPFNSEVGDKEATALVHGCPNLEVLDITGTNVTSKGLLAIRDHCRALWYIRLEGHAFPGGEFHAGFFPPHMTVVQIIY
jgi:hypothetical protein